MLIYGRNSSGRKKPSAKQLQMRQERKEFFAGILNGRKASRPNNMPDLSVNNSVPLSNNLHVSGGYKRSIDDYKWRRGREESAETVKEIEKKKSRIAPLWNKGSTMYITNEEDPKTLGKKV